MTARTLGVEAGIFPGMGHGMMLEADWRSVVQHVLEWLPDAFASMATVSRQDAGVI
jgi:hypothetical protein